MKSLVKRVYFSNWWAYIIKCWWFFLLIRVWNFICKSLDSRTKKLKRKWFLLKLKRTLINFILTRWRIFYFKRTNVSFPGCFTEISFIVKWIKVSSYSCRFEMTRWLWFFLLNRVQINSIFSWADIISAIKRESSGFIFSPNCTCGVKMFLLIRIVMTWPKLLSLWDVLLIFHIC